MGEDVDTAEQKDDISAEPAAGYVPLHLTLKGFKGIRSGLGRDVLALDLDAICGDATLVAFSGANGRGKSTIIDNLHPLC